LGRGLGLVSFVGLTIPAMNASLTCVRCFNEQCCNQIPKQLDFASKTQIDRGFAAQSCEGPIRRIG
jgi:hypothetical protein